MTITPGHVGKSARHRSYRVTERGGNEADWIFK